VRQVEFERLRAGHWARFERWLDRHDAGQARFGRRKQAAQAEDEDPLPDTDVPAAYRHLSADLALARDRQYSPDLVDRLNRLALRGHHVLYGARSGRIDGVLAFFSGGFPRLVRKHGGLTLLAAFLFFGPLIALTVLIPIEPEFAGLILDPGQMHQMQSMYQPGNERLGMDDADSRFAMFGFYVWNNIRIGFQTFAGGIVFGLGTLFFLVYNGIFIGAVGGYLIQVGLAAQFFSFTSGHSPLELTAIALSGTAGLLLGRALFAPGPRSRKAALVEAGRDAVQVMAGAAAMFLAAALVEAFWSPITSLDLLVKQLVGAALWVVVLAYLGFAGRDRAA